MAEPTPSFDPTPAPNEGKSPLEEADPNSLDDLFSMDPLGYTQLQLDKVITELRRYRAIWEKEEKEGKIKSSAKQPKVSKPNVSLGDLGL